SLASPRPQCGSASRARDRSAWRARLSHSFGMPRVSTSATSADDELSTLLPSSRHPVHARFLVPLRRELLRLRPELDRALAGDVAGAEFRFVPAAEAEGLAGDGHADIHAHHARAGLLHHIARDAAALREDRRRIAVR